MVAGEARVVGFRWLTPECASVDRPLLRPAFELRVRIRWENSINSNNSPFKRRPVLQCGDAVAVRIPSNDADVRFVLDRIAVGADEQHFLSPEGPSRRDEELSSVPKKPVQSALPSPKPGSAAARRSAALARKRQQRSEAVSAEAELIQSKGLQTGNIVDQHRVSGSVVRRRNANWPGHLPVGRTLAAGELLRWWVDLRAVPKKRTLRALASRCTNSIERAILLKWADPHDAEGATTYRALCVVGGWPSLPDLLQRFSSCKPTLEDILCWYPALPPRYYSVASICPGCQFAHVSTPAPVVSSAGEEPADHLAQAQLGSATDGGECETSFVLNLNEYTTKWSIAAERGIAVEELQPADLEDADGCSVPSATRVRSGLGARYLADAGLSLIEGSSCILSPPTLQVSLKKRKAPFEFTFPSRAADDDDDNTINSESVDDQVDITAPQPASAWRPVIALGAGTGIAPFRAFLQAMLLARADTKPGIHAAAAPTSYMFAGSRYPEDALLADELRSLCELANVEYVQALSRVTSERQYVQHVLAAPPFRERVAAALGRSFRCAFAGLTPLDIDADPLAPSIYLCGDARGLYLGVSSALASLLDLSDPRFDSIEPGAAIDLLTQKGWFVADIW